MEVTSASTQSSGKFENASITSSVTLIGTATNTNAAFSNIESASDQLSLSNTDT